MSEKKIRLLVRLISDSNYVLHKGEPGININTMIFKIGDGATKWSNLQAINVNLNDYYNKSQVDSKLTTELADYYT